MFLCKTLLMKIREFPFFCDLLFSSCIYVEETLAYKILQAENMANTIDETLIFMHLSAIQIHLCGEELLNTAFY